MNVRRDGVKVIARRAAGHAVAAARGSAAMPPHCVAAARQAAPATAHRLWASSAACSRGVVSTSRSLAQCTYTTACGAPANPALPSTRSEIRRPCRGTPCGGMGLPAGQAAAPRGPGATAWPLPGSHPHWCTHSPRPSALRSGPAALPSLPPAPAACAQSVPPLPPRTCWPWPSRTARAPAPLRLCAAAAAAGSCVPPGRPAWAHMRGLREWELGGGGQRRAAAAAQPAVPCCRLLFTASMGRGLSPGLNPRSAFWSELRP